MPIYTPAEDSYLLAESVKKFAKGRVLDMGTGSGIQAQASLENKKVLTVTAADVNNSCEKELKKMSSRINFIRSDLFTEIPKQKFGTIIFNPPYLPQDKGISDATIYGGKKGHETIERFLNKCGSYLADRGIILLLFSSRTNKNKIDEIIANNLLTKAEIARKQLPMFEKLHVYKIWKSKLLKQLEGKNISDARKFAVGNRGLIYTGKLKNRKIAIKAQRENAAAKTIANEIKWLKKLNKCRIGPKLIFSGKDYFVYEFAEGQYINEFISSNSRRKITAAIKNVMQQCRTMDKLKLNKLEMLRPHRHAVVTKSGRVVLLDFERCRISRKPKNVTQFCQYLLSGNLQSLLAGKMLINREKLIEAAKKYKSQQTETSYDNIVRLLK
ncbi:methyltransferase [Candidatus Woesearchaeota archaeon]|nr:methyltransferase [Candidatus Woesearchaeota archaeon]